MKNEEIKDREKVLGERIKRKDGEKDWKERMERKD